MPIHIGEFGVRQYYKNSVGTDLTASPAERSKFVKYAKCEIERRDLSWAYWSFAQANWGMYIPEKTDVNNNVVTAESWAPEIDVPLQASCTTP